VKHEQNNRKNTRNIIAEKAEIIREVDKKEKTKTEISQPYKMQLSTLFTSLKKPDSTKNQALQRAEFSKEMRIHEAKHDLKDKLFKWIS
jgi:hypothetical protein